MTNIQKQRKKQNKRTILPVLAQAISPSLFTQANTEIHPEWCTIHVHVILKSIQSPRALNRTEIKPYKLKTRNPSFPYLEKLL